MTPSTSTPLIECNPQEVLRRLRVERGKSRARLAHYQEMRRPRAASAERQLLALIETEIGRLAAEARSPRS